MLAERRAGTELIFIDLEKVDSPHRFTEVVLLDILAVASTPQTIDQVWAAMKAQMALDDRHAIVRLLTSLAQDHYLTADTEKRYAFRFPLIRQWWILAQGLSS